MYCAHPSWSIAQVKKDHVSQLHIKLVPCSLNNTSTNYMLCTYMYYQPFRITFVQLDTSEKHTSIYTVLATCTCSVHELETQIHDTMDLSF